MASTDHNPYLAFGLAILGGGIFSHGHGGGGAIIRSNEAFVWETALDAVEVEGLADNGSIVVGGLNPATLATTDGSKTCYARQPR